MPILNSHDLTLEESHVWHERKPLLQMHNARQQFMQLTPAQARLLANAITLYLNGDLTNESQNRGPWAIDADGDLRLPVDAARAQKRREQLLREASSRANAESGSASAANIS